MIVFIGNWLNGEKWAFHMKMERKFTFWLKFTKALFFYGIKGTCEPYTVKPEKCTSKVRGNFDLMWLSYHAYHNYFENVFHIYALQYDVGKHANMLFLFNCVIVIVSPKSNHRIFLVFTLMLLYNVFFFFWILSQFTL